MNVALVKASAADGDVALFRSVLVRVPLCTCPLFKIIGIKRDTDISANRRVSHEAAKPCCSIRSLLGSVQLRNATANQLPICGPSTVIRCCLPSDLNCRSYILNLWSAFKKFLGNVMFSGLITG